MGANQEGNNSDAALRFPSVIIERAGKNSMVEAGVQILNYVAEVLASLKMINEKDDPRKTVSTSGSLQMDSEFLDHGHGEFDDEVDDDDSLGDESVC